MRGTFGVDFGPDTVFRVGKALPGVVGGPRWLVGRDARASSPIVRDALVAGLREAGADVTDIGLCTTPMTYFFTGEDGYDGSVMVTASHNPPGDNGLKVSRRSAMPVGYSSGLDTVERLVSSDTSPVPAAFPVSGSDGRRWIDRYVAWQREAVPDASLADLRYAVDCSGGTAAILAKDLFPGAVLLNCAVDGAFSCHAPNPLRPDAREQAAEAVREQGLDCAVIFDGDADRCIFLDEKGDFVQPDFLVPVVAKASLAAAARGSGAERAPARPKVVHDVRTGRGAVEALRAMGCEPVMVPVGHAFAKPALRECGAICGGELAGHYYFRDFFCCDSGVLAARRILSEAAAAKAAGRSFSGMMAPVSQRFANSGELNFKVDDKDAAIARVLECARENLPAEVSRSAIDGIRLEFNEGWFCIRKSNTEPYLRLVIECDTARRLSEWRILLEGAIGPAK